MTVWQEDEVYPEAPAAYATDPGTVVPGRAGAMVRAVGGLVSVALIAGVVVWGYKLAQRQIHGVPVIAAPEGPARVAPEDPGGELADHQGLAVNMIAAEGEAEAAADLLVLAPRAATLSDEDTASDALQVTAGSPLAPLDAVPGPNIGTVRPSPSLEAAKAVPDSLKLPLPEEAAEPIDAPELETVEAGSVEVASIEAALMEANAFEPLDGTAAEGIDPSVPGVSTSLIPVAKPAGLVPMRQEVTLVSAAADRPVEDVAPAAITAGTTLAQIGDYPSEAEAQAAWAAEVARFGALFNGKARVIEPATRGDETFYRLRVMGFADRDEARRFCAALNAEGRCVAVTVR